jgi:hypothetical protein
MQIDDFLKLVPAQQKAKSQQATLDMWCHIYTYIEQKGSADTVDDNFLSHVHKLKYLSTAAIGTHLRKMASNGLIEGHVMRVAPGQRNSCNILPPIMGGMLPSQFIRYTLPGKEVPMHFQRAEEARSEMARIANDAMDMIHKGPKEVTNLHHVGDLHLWLSGLYSERKPISAEENDRLHKLVADASELLREQEAEIRKFYTSVAVRSNLEPGA